MFFLKELPTQKMLEKYAKEYSDMDAEVTMDALKMLRTASLLLRKIDAYFTENGFSQTRFLILIVIDREPEKDHFSIMDIVNRLDISKPIVTNSVKGLQENKLLSVKDCPLDKRSKRVKITAQGKKKLKSLLPGYYQLINSEMRTSKL